MLRDLSLTQLHFKSAILICREANESDPIKKDILQTERALVQVRINKKETEKKCRMNGYRK